jgi:hypothetical protein
MSSGPGPIVPLWRDAAAPPAAATDPAWRSVPPRAPYRPRWRKLGLVALLALGCLTALTYAALWLRPPEPARLVVLHAGYDTNLAVPVNPYGKAAARQLAGLTRPPGGFFGTHRRLNGAAESARLTRGHVASFLPDLDSVREKCVVVVLAAHGGRDRDGAFLFPDDATPDPAHRLRMKAVLARLAQLPAAKQKLLVLDATQPPAYPDLGLVHNDFAAALLDLEPDVAAVPNLVVLTSTGPDQRSWASPEHGVTIFAHHLSEGLLGAADADGDRRVTGWELAEYVRAKVHDWARDHRAALQDPVLLPRGPEGEARARAMHLAMTDGKPRPAAEAPAPFEPPAEVEQLWQEYRELAGAYVPPTAYTPHLWRQYEAWALRYEQLVLAGDTEGARAVRAKAAKVKQKIEAARTLDISPQTLALPCALGGVKYYSKVPPAFHEAIGRVATAAGPVERAKAWADAQAAAAGIDPAAARLLWGRALVEWVAADPLPRLPAVPDVLPLVTEGMTVRPAELHFLYMLSKHLPAVERKDKIGPLLGEVLKLRLYAEEAILHLRPTGYSYAELFWPASGSSADIARGKAEDLCFATDTESWEKAAKAAAEAWAGFRYEQQIFAVSQEATTWQSYTARLPAMSEWLIRGGLWSERNDRFAHDQRLQDALAPWQRSLSVFDSPEFKQWATQLAKQLRDLDTELTRQTMADLLAVRPEIEANQTPRAGAIRWWHAADAVLTAPIPDGVTPAQRREFLREYRRVSRQLQVTGQTRPEVLPEVSSDTTRERAFEAARRRGVLILGSMREWDVNAIARIRPGEGYEQLLFRVNRFPFQADGRQSLAEAGSRIGDLIAAVPSAKGEIGLDGIRIAPACVPVTDEPIQQHRRDNCTNLLAGQAERTGNDNWYGEASEPYYKTAIRQLRTDTTRLNPNSAVEGWVGPYDTWLKADSLFPFDPLLPKKIAVTDELDPTFDLMFDTEGGYGAAVFWYTQPFPPATKTPSRPRIVVSDESEGKPVSVRVPLARPPVPSATPAPVSGSLTVSGFFRGRVIEPKAAVDFYSVPDKAAVTLPPLPSATLAVRASPRLHGLFGEAAGSVAFVLDCSGSMRPNPDVPGDLGRYPKAVEVLGRLIRDLPPGTTVGVWAFGQRTPGAKTAEDTIRELRPPAPLPADRAGYLAALRADLPALEPWDLSPVARAIVRAKAGLAAAPGPFKAVVLVSDAEDNRYAEDAGFAKAGRPLADTLRAEFTAAGTSLAVVAFAGDAKLQAPFRVAAERSVGGLFVPVENARAVSDWLRTGLNPRIRYAVEPLTGGGGGADLDAGVAGADVWYGGRLPAGDYRVKVLGPAAAAWTVKLAKGDRLLLELLPDLDRLALRRVWSADTDPAIGRAPREKDQDPKPDWKLAVRQTRLPGPGAAELFAVLDDRPRVESVYKPTHVGDVWFDVTPATGGGPVGVRWRTGVGFPAPSWWLDTRGWPVLPGGTASPVVDVWWHPVGPFPAAGSWRFPDGPRVGVRDVPVKLGDSTVTIDGVTVEEHTVEVSPWTLAKKRCLVVRLTCPPDSPFWVRPTGLTPDGSEVRLYGKANKVTCLFWWADRDPDVNALTGFEFVSLLAAVRDAKKAGHHLRLDDIPGPTDAPPRIEPPVPAK